MFGLPPLPRTLEAALRDVSHERVDVRRSALHDLVRLAEGPSRPRAIGALARALQADVHADVRADAAIALADSKGREARAELLRALDDAVLGVRQLAVLALGEACEPNDPDVLSALGSLLASEHAALRFQALIAWERLAGDETEAALVAASGDSDDEVRSMAFRLARKRFENAEPPAELLANARAAVDGPVTTASVTAALFLAARGERSAERTLVELLAGTAGASEADVFAAIEAAMELGLESARPALVRRAFGLFGVRTDTLGWQSCIALARLGDERAKLAIVRRLSAFRRDARTFAVVAAGEAGLSSARETILAFRGDPSRADPEAVEEALSRLGRVE
jgi:HEAT repeat protein